LSCLLFFVYLRDILVLLCHETKTFLLLFSPSVLINARYARLYQLYGGYTDVPRVWYSWLTVLPFAVSSTHTLLRQNFQHVIAWWLSSEFDHISINLRPISLIVSPISTVSNSGYHHFVDFDWNAISHSPL
jgi:hypothetical protein